MTQSIDQPQKVMSSKNNVANVSKVLGGHNGQDKECSSESKALGAKSNVMARNMTKVTNLKPTYGSLHKG